MTGALRGLELVPALTAIAATGVRAVEVTVEPAVALGALVAAGVAADGIGAAVAASGLRLCGLAASSELVLGHPDLPRLLALAGELDAPFVRVFLPPYDPGHPAEAQLASAARELARLAASGGGVRVLVEPARGTVAPSPELARRLLEEAGGDSIGVVYDPANLLAEGHLHPAYAVALLGDLIGHVHVKNVVHDRRVAGSATHYVTLDQGDVDWPETLAALEGAGYAGILSIDHLSGVGAPSTLPADVRALHGLLGRR